MSTRDSRLDRLERQHGLHRACPQCFDRPFRVAVIDGKTDEVLDENFPPSGCPGCGQPLYGELQIIGEGDDQKVTGC